MGTHRQFALLMLLIAVGGATAGCVPEKTSGTSFSLGDPLPWQLRQHLIRGCIWVAEVGELSGQDAPRPASKHFALNVDRVEIFNSEGRLLAEVKVVQGRFSLYLARGDVGPRGIAVIRVPAVGGQFAQYEFDVTQRESVLDIVLASV